MYSSLVILVPLVILCVLALYALRHYVVKAEPNRIEISRHEVSYPDLPTELDGFIICQVSDTHITAWPRNQQAIAEAIRSVDADLYVLTGDMIFLQSGVEAFFKWFDALGDSIRPAVAVLGNAENKPYVKRNTVEEGLAERNVPLLNNRVLDYPVCGMHLQIVGVDDPHTLHSDFVTAYKEADPDRWTLLLCPSPDGVVDLKGRRADLMLCGHTHGGQVRFPLVGALVHGTRKVRGLVSGWYEGDALRRRARGEVGSTKLYVTRGLGMSKFGLRFLCPPELPVFTLKRRI
jgi:predicted MPP superfamily phosphohydrolase